MSSMVDEVCRDLGIGPSRKVKSTKGRIGKLVGVEYSSTNNGKVWLLLEGPVPGPIQVPRNKFIKSNDNKT